MSRKGENIYKRKDGRWEGRYIKSRTCTGKIVYGYVYAKTYREVKAKLREKALSYNAQPVVSVAASSALFSEIASDWFANIGLQTKESTRNKYHNILCDYILPEYGERTLDSITYRFIKADILCNRKWNKKNDMDNFHGSSGFLRLE